MAPDQKSKPKDFMNHHKRHVQKTCFIYCEGRHDAAFLNCLKSYYLNQAYNIDIKRGSGGDQINLVKKAINKSFIYDKKYAIMDADRDQQEMKKAKTLAEDNGLSVIQVTPCMERLLVNILEPNKRLAEIRWKSYFETKYIPTNKRTEKQAYSTIFTKIKLDTVRTRLAELDNLIKIFEAES